MTTIEGQRELSIAVQTQLRIVASQLAPEAALQFIVQQTKDATGADGAAFGMLLGEELVYRAAAGTASAILGSHRMAKSSLAAPCIAESKMVQLGHTPADSQAPDLGLCGGHDDLLAEERG